MFAAAEQTQTPEDARDAHKVVIERSQPNLTSSFEGPTAMDLEAARFPRYFQPIKPQHDDQRPHKIALEFLTLIE